MIYAAVCKHLGIKPMWNPAQSLPPPIVPLIEVNTAPQFGQEQLRQMVSKIYDIVADYHQMQELLVASPNERPPLFDALRKNYPVRREFHQTTVKLPKDGYDLRQIVAKLGFSGVHEDLEKTVIRQEKV